ncbi:bifunctional folylpolyglutamate synthase/dihydrofolate synthase [Candidatus Bipolaricaulota bacterium]|nr:bifunctional folylpolyglutamate synthase/dihydrofolate synthase [Candidatus Bipolaricaulota bacterium]
MDYAEARRALQGLPSLKVKPGLDRIVRLLEHLGHPERSFPAIHIAGTNGKGSVAAMLSSVLSRAGHRVGRFTSPDLIDFRDRISVNNEWISEEEFAAQVERISPLLTDTTDRPTLYEVLTAVALSHFAAHDVDLAVVEVGLGGRYDSTNVVRPILTILTTVDLDHTDLLGDTIGKIAWEKAGIAKEGVPFLIGNLPPEAKRVVLEECEEVGAPLSSVTDITLRNTLRNLEYAAYKVIATSLPESVKIPLVASYQQENLRLVLRAVVELRKSGLSIPDDAITSGLAATSWPGRFEVVGRDPLIVLDGAHNPHAIRALAGEVKSLFPQRDKRHLLFGVLADKDYASMADTLFPLFSHVTLTRSASPRALDPDVLAGLAKKLSGDHSVTGSVAEGLSFARAGLGRDDALLIAGSLTVVREARALLLKEQ